MTIRMIRVYDTSFEFDTDDVQEALKQFAAMPDEEKNYEELEQCCIMFDEVLMPGEKYSVQIKNI